MNRDRLEESPAELALDESLEETFPASDPPAHSTPRESREPIHSGDRS
ncbi:MAG TPA: hypothetical protein VMJ70_15465 [Candidatus Sulfotelmatobacter sp.]|nr:hypothetical protein [Candidatus Sulfotelmatobacter sp.]